MRSQKCTRLNFDWFDGTYFYDFGRFLPVLVNFDRFWGPFFPFGSHFQLADTVYSRREPDPDV
jgi:hypothetical protein